MLGMTGAMIMGVMPAAAQRRMDDQQTGEQIAVKTMHSRVKSA